MSTLTLIWDWLIQSFTSIWTWLYSGSSWIGVSLISLYVLRRVINVLRKIY